MRYGALLELVGALRANNLNIPAGSQWQSEKQQEVIIRTLSELNGVEDIQNTVVRANSFGEPVYVKDVADVKKGFQRRTNVIRTNGQSAHHVTVFKKKTGDIITLVDDVKALMASDKIMLPQGVSYDFLDDRSYFVKRRLGVLSNNLLVGLIPKLTCFCQTIWSQENVHNVEQQLIAKAVIAVQPPLGQKISNILKVLYLPVFPFSNPHDICGWTCIH